MAAKDIYHDNFVRALIKDGWTITDDPLTIPYKGTEVLIDVGAERLLAATHRGRFSLALLVFFAGNSRQSALC